MARSFTSDIKEKEKDEQGNQPLTKKNRKRGEISKDERAEIAMTKKIKVEEKDMRKVYIDAYGMELDFAGYYYHSSKFIPNQDDLILTLCWHITPEGKNKVVQTTF